MQSKGRRRLIGFEIAIFSMMVWMLVVVVIVIAIVSRMSQYNQINQFIGANDNMIGMSETVKG